MPDVIIIGGGVTGSAVAMELSKKNISVCVLEKEEDVCCGTSKANSAIMHAGFDARVGSLMARLNVRGNMLIGELADNLDIPFVRNGSFVVCTVEEDIPDLQALYNRGIANGVSDMVILSKDEALALEPNLSENTVAVLYAKSAGIICPFQMTIAFAENARENGVDFVFDTKVEDIIKEDDTYILNTTKGIYKSRYVINAAGVHADEIHNMVSDYKMVITPRRGDYMLLDKGAGSHVSKTIFALPGKYGKGVLVTPTIHGNLIVGPTAIDIEDKEGTNTTYEGMKDIIDKSKIAVRDIPLRQVITSFAGLRAHESNHEFIIQEVEDSKGFIDVAAIESPGLTSAPAIGEMVVGILESIMDMEDNPNYNPTRKRQLHLESLSIDDRNELIAKDPAYGNIICRCEMISEGEIIDSIHRPIGARSLDGVKRRVRAGMGRCQGGFCSPRVMEILSRELGIPIQDITKSGGESSIIIG